MSSRRLGFRLHSILFPPLFCLDKRIADQPGDSDRYVIALVICCVFLPTDISFQHCRNFLLTGFSGSGQSFFTVVGAICTNSVPHVFHAAISDMPMTLNRACVSCGNRENPFSRTNTAMSTVNSVIWSYTSVRICPWHFFLPRLFRWQSLSTVTLPFSYRRMANPGHRYERSAARMRKLSGFPVHSVLMLILLVIKIRFVHFGLAHGQPQIRTLPSGWHDSNGHRSHPRPGKRAGAGWHG